MKKLKSVYIILIISVLNMSFYQTQYTLYEDAKHGVSIKHLSNWTFVENPKTAFIFIRPMEEQGQKFKENINLTVVDIGNAKLSKLVEMSLKNMDKLLVDYKKIGTEYLKIDSKEYAKTTYTHNMQGLPLKVMLYQVMKNNKGYNLTCTSTGDTFNKYAPVFEEMIKSFDIK